MKIHGIKTDKVVPYKKTIFEVLDKHLKVLPERSILAVTSKIVAICEGRVARVEESDKDKLIQQESQYYLPRTASRYDVMLTITRNMLMAAAGIDESNGNGYYILWPEDPQKTANEIRAYLVKRFKLKHVGVIITDSKTTPLKWGTSGVSLSHSGFAALKSYIDTPDIFGRKLKMTKANVMDALAVSAVLVMGEGSEQTPLAVIKDVPFITFQSRNPTKKELAELTISLEDDLYAPLLTGVKWRKGKAIK